MGHDSAPIMISPLGGGAPGGRPFLDMPFTSIDSAIWDRGRPGLAPGKTSARFGVTESIGDSGVGVDPIQASGWMEARGDDPSSVC